MFEYSYQSWLEGKFYIEGSTIKPLERNEFIHTKRWDQLTKQDWKQINDYQKKLAQEGAIEFAKDALDWVKGKARNYHESYNFVSDAIKDLDFILLDRKSEGHTFYENENLTEITLLFLKLGNLSLGRNFLLQIRQCAKIKVKSCETIHAPKFKKKPEDKYHVVSYTIGLIMVRNALKGALELFEQSKLMGNEMSEQECIEYIQLYCLTHPVFFSSEALRVYETYQKNIVAANYYSDYCALYYLMNTNNLLIPGTTPTKFLQFLKQEKGPYVKKLTKYRQLKVNNNPSRDQIERFEDARRQSTDKFLQIKIK